MIRLFRNIRDTFKVLKYVRKNPAIFKIVDDLFKFVNTTHENQKPMVTEIVLLNMKDGTKISDFVSLWAGIGEANLIKRAEHLKAQNVELKRLLQLYQNNQVTPEDKKQIQMVLEIFE